MAVSTTDIISSKRLAAKGPLTMSANSTTMQSTCQIKKKRLICLGLGGGYFEEHLKGTL